MGTLQGSWGHPPTAEGGVCLLLAIFLIAVRKPGGRNELGNGLEGQILDPPFSSFLVLEAGSYVAQASLDLYM